MDAGGSMDAMDEPTGAQRRQAEREQAEVITEWLRSWWDVDERIALEASDYVGPWPGDTPETPAEIHIDRWSPDRVLAWVVGQRALLDAIMAMRRSTHSSRGAKNGTYRSGPVGPDPRLPLLRALAQPYAGRPGWREEWAA